MPTGRPPKGLISVLEAAAILERDPTLVRRLIKRNIIPATKLGRDWVMKESDVRKVSEMERPPGRPVGWSPYQ
jgi:excisionase family DNA binding protein